MKNLATRLDSWDEEIVAEVNRGVYVKRVPITTSDNWLDVGAHIGAFAIQAATLGAEVDAFEPDEENYSMAVMNIGNAHLTHRIRIACGAIGGGLTGQRNFYINTKNNKGTHSFYTQRGREIRSVMCWNINEILEVNLRINKIKLDCEGSELEILYALNFERFKIEAIVGEFHSNVLRDSAHLKYWALMAHLKKYFKHVAYPEDPKKAWTTMFHASNLEEG